MCLWLLFYTDSFIHSLVLIWLTGFYSHVSSPHLSHPSLIHQSFPLFYTSSSIFLFSSADAAGQTDKDMQDVDSPAAAVRVSVCDWVYVCVCVWVRPYLIHFVFPSFLMWTMKVMYHSLFCFGRNGDRWFHYEDPVNHLLPWCRTEMFTACPQTQR